MQRTVLSIIICGLLFIFLTSIAYAERIMFTTGPSAGGWYPTGAGMSEIIKNEIPGLNITVKEGGGVGNIREVSSNRAQLGYTFSNTFNDALNGKEPFKNKVENISGFLTLYFSYYQAIVHDNSNIESYHDLYDKDIAPGRRNWSGEILTRRILESYDLSYDKIKEEGGKISYIGFSDMTMQMRDKNIDAAMGCTAAPSSFIMDLMSTHDIRFLEVDKNNAEAIMNKYAGYDYKTMPANTYANQNEPVKTLGTYTIITIRKDLSEEFVYNMTKAVMENLDEYHKVHPVAKNLTIDSALNAFPDMKMVHPGVVKYFKEIS